MKIGASKRISQPGALAPGKSTLVVTAARISAGISAIAFGASCPT